MKNKVVAWWSGGITSAVACKMAIELYGVDNVDVLFIDTKNEDEDTYRFMMDCQKWYGTLIGSITGIGDKYNSIQDVWIKHKSLNVAKGAVCSSELKRSVREKWEKTATWEHQVFGFDISESGRARSMKMNHGHTKPIFPLLFHALSKKDCINIVVEAGIEPPRAYQWGFHNNNCLGATDDVGGCVQGGIGYWQKMEQMFPKKFDSMAEMEHKLTNLKGKPVTMLKDQSKDGGLVFLKKHPDYPNIKQLSDMEGRPPKPLVECNGFCGTHDLSKRNDTADEINYDDGLSYQGKLF